MPDISYLRWPHLIELDQIKGVQSIVLVKTRNQSTDSRYAKNNIDRV